MPINALVPNLTDFTAFVYAQGVTTAELPTNSPYLQASLDYAENMVIDSPPNISAVIYVDAVYNLGFHKLLKITPDQTGQTFFADSRKQYGLLSFVAGPVVVAGDQGTGDSLLPAEWMKDMTLLANDCLKTPWGQSFLMYQQDYGPTIVGVS